MATRPKPDKPRMRVESRDVFIADDDKEFATSDECYDYMLRRDIIAHCDDRCDYDPCPEDVVDAILEKYDIIPHKETT